MCALMKTIRFKRIHQRSEAEKNSDNGFKCQKMLLHFLVTELIIIACDMQIFTKSVWQLCGVKAGLCGVSA